MKKIKIQYCPCNDTGPENNTRAIIMGPNLLSIVICTNRLKMGNIINRVAISTTFSTITNISDFLSLSICTATADSINNYNNTTTTLYDNNNNNINNNYKINNNYYYNINNNNNIIINNNSNSININNNIILSQKKYY